MTFKSIEVGVYPGDGVLDPRWEPTQYFSKKLDKWVTSQADVTVVGGKDGSGSTAWGRHSTA